MFALYIHVTADRLEALKAELTRTMSDVKSSHRCEAMARGLGYGRYASTLAATKNGMIDKVLVRGELFVAYLADHGFAVSAQPFYAAAAKVALRNIAGRIPKLTVWGIGVGRPRRKEDGHWETSQELNAKFIRDREELTDDGAVKAFLASLAFISLVTPTKTIRTGSGSYWLKHIAENYVCTYPEGEKLGPIYVPNGILIAAALYAGFEMRTFIDDFGYDEVNVSFNISKSCLKNLDCEIRPDGAHAQSRRHRERMRIRGF